MIRITELKLTPDQAMNSEMEINNLRKILKNRFYLHDVSGLTIFKKAIDARKKNGIILVYTVDFSSGEENRLLRLKDKHISLTPDMKYYDVPCGDKTLKERPIIVGFGPSGMFAGLLLSRRGYKPLIIEMGLDVDRRDEAYQKFIDSRIFKKEASIQFGEGGAGTYSDGKLTTSINDLRCRLVLETMVKYGAEEELMYINKPHVGTDRLKLITKSIRKEIIDLGGQIIFGTQLTDLIVKDGKIVAIEINNKDIIKTDVLLMGIGHSSRDTFELLKTRNLNLMRKPFSIGVRIEHPQSLINESQYGEFKNHKALKAADYKLAYHDDNGRSCYTFCMCPGGYVMCGSSEDGGVVTNGMSESKRDGENANSAVLVNIQTDDFKGEDVLAGMYFQRQLERMAFKEAGGNYNAPAQLVGDFLKNRKSDKYGLVKPTYNPGITFVDFNRLLPEFVSKTLKKGLLDFDNKLKGFAMNDALMTGFETRSSSPIRIVRDDLCETNIKGIFSMGEGAGYAGGIMSSAVDGIKVAEEIVRRYKPLQ